MDAIKIKLLEEIESKSGYGLKRIFLSSEEIKAANELVKQGILIKGKADEKGGTLAFFLNISQKELNKILQNEG